MNNTEDDIQDMEPSEESSHEEELQDKNNTECNIKDMESSEESSHEEELEDMTKDNVQDLDSSEEGSHEDESEDNDSSADSGTSTLALDGASVSLLKSTNLQNIEIIILV